MPRRCLIPLAACVLFSFASLVRADWSLTTADFSQQQHLTINTWSPAEGLSATDQSGKLVAFPTRDLLSLSSGQKADPNPETRAWKLQLRNGDVLYGHASKLSGKSLIFAIPDIDEIAIPIRNIASLSAPATSGGARPRRLPEAADHDIVLFRDSGDRLEGIFAGVDETQLQILADNADAPTPIALSKVDTLVLGGVKPPRTVPSLSLRLTFATSGSVLTIPADKPDSFSWSLNQIKLKDPAGQDHTVNTERLAKVEVLGGRVVYLTELDPDREDQVTFLGTSWPYQVDKNALGQPLRIGHVTYDRGIGAHTKSTLYYALDGTFDTLSLRVGLDDSAAPNGEAHASIVLDGKTLWDSKTLKPGEISPELSLPIKGGRHLELHADPAARLDVQGRVDWINVALRR